MTIKPKAKKYRIRRSGSLAKPIDSAPEGDQSKVGDSNPTHPAFDETTKTEDGFGDEHFATASKTSPDVSKDVSDEIEEIKQEGLTGRQLRMARRVAVKNSLEPTSDYDAIRLLRKKGIDPFQRSNMLELVTPKSGGTTKIQLPKISDPDGLPSTKVMTEDTRGREIYQIQQDIAKRRRRQLLLLVSRLSFFVFLPTFLIGFYYYTIATP